MDLFDNSQFNDICISDTKTPIVVFIGLEACGKTLALFRMIRFLEAKSYHVVPVEDFRCDSDYRYKRLCSILKERVYSPYLGWLSQDFLLIKVLNTLCTPICQIAKIPGFSIYGSLRHRNFPTYIDTLISSGNKKVWVFFVEQDWGNNQEERNIYSQKICSLQNLISPNDKIVFLFSKSDLQRSNGRYDKYGKPIKKLIFKQIRHEYPDIFIRYQNSGLKKLLFGEFSIKSICFSAGWFNRMIDGQMIWTPESDWYCSEFWNAIQMAVK